MNFFDTTVTPDAFYEVEQCLLSNRLSEGERVRLFELALEEKFRMKNVVAVNSGTSALHLALVLAGVHEGDEVILPAQTFVATGLAVLYCGAKPVFADIGIDGNIDIADVLRKITKKTKAIISVSWGGNPYNLEDLGFIGSSRTIAIIQDNAHALGATLNGEPLSEYGYKDVACYSFQAIKSLTCGDGGAIVLPTEWAYQKVRRLRWFGIDREKDAVDDTGERHYNLKEIGFKYHMSDYCAALGLGNLEGFNERLERVRQIADRYNDSLPPEYIVAKKDGCSYWLYDLLVPDRRNFIKAMKARNIPVSVVHVGIDRNDIFGGTQDLPTQRYWDEHHVCIPIHSGLTDEDVDQIITAVRQGW